MWSPEETQDLLGDGGQQGVGQAAGRPRGVSWDRFSRYCHGCLNPGAGLSRVGKTVQPAPGGTAPWELKDKKGLMGHEAWALSWLDYI